MIARVALVALDGLRSSVRTIWIHDRTDPTGSTLHGIQCQYSISDLCFILTMKTIQGVVAVVLLCSDTTAFNHQYQRSVSQSSRQSPKLFSEQDRRVFLVNSVATTSGLLAVLTTPLAALAIPMVSTPEFESVLRDSARSVQVVEFSGPRSTIATVRLVDGTTFGINDIIESSTDPRSPLQLAATCRQYKVPCKFVMLEEALSSVPKKKKLYQNEIVQKAAGKEKLRKERMQQDENDRLAAMYQLEEQEAKTRLSQ
jgi:hypothetical protein